MPLLLAQGAVKLAITMTLNGNLDRSVFHFRQLPWKIQVVQICEELGKVCGSVLIGVSGNDRGWVPGVLTPKQHLSLS